MTEEGLTPGLIVELARRRGLALDLERAEALRPVLESLARRLAAMAEALPRDAEPAPPPRPPR